MLSQFCCGPASTKTGFHWSGLGTSPRKLAFARRDANLRQVSSLLTLGSRLPGLSCIAGPTPPTQRALRAKSQDLYENNGRTRPARRSRRVPLLLACLLACWRRPLVFRSRVPLLLLPPALRPGAATAPRPLPKQSAVQVQRLRTCTKKRQRPAGAPRRPLGQPPGPSHHLGRPPPSAGEGRQNGGVPASSSGLAGKRGDGTGIGRQSPPPSRRFARLSMRTNLRVNGGLSLNRSQ